MPQYRSRTSTHGRNMAGARGLWRATGMKDADFGKPIVAIANSFTQFVPGHVHLKDLGQLVAREIERAGGVAKEFNTIAVDDGIAMGHGGMLYSLPSRELIADSVEYMVNAHCADALVCISNCDKITPGMLMAALRLNIPAIFVSGGPMEAGKVTLKGKTIARRSHRRHDRSRGQDGQRRGSDGRSSGQPARLAAHARACSRRTRMNCLTEALGLALPGNGTLVATHADRKELFLEAGRRIVELAKRYYERGDESALPRKIATFEAFENAMSARHRDGRLHEHGSAFARRRGRGGRSLHHGRHRPAVPQHALPLQGGAQQNDVHLEDVHRAGGVMAILGQLDRAGLIHRECATVHARTMAEALDGWDISQTENGKVQEFYRARRAAFGPRRPSASRSGPRRSISTAPRALSARRKAPSRRMAGSRCCTAISQWTAAS